jgi:protocatechuate 3,4-dioxygenase beta subunit
MSVLSKYEIDAGNTSLVTMTIADTTGAPIVGATLKMNLLDRSGAAVAGFPVNLALADLGAGRYQAKIPSTIAKTLKGGGYSISITGTDTDGNALDIAPPAEIKIRTK